MHAVGSKLDNANHMLASNPYQKKSVSVKVVDVGVGVGVGGVGGGGVGGGGWSSVLGRGRAELDSGQPPFHARCMVESRN